MVLLSQFYDSVISTAGGWVNCNGVCCTVSRTVLLFVGGCVWEGVVVVQLDLVFYAVSGMKEKYEYIQYKWV